MGIVKKLNRGFTIVELLIVVVVIAILVTVVVVGYGAVQRSARNAAVLADLDKLDGIQTQYGLQNSTGGKAWYSPSGQDVDLGFTPSEGNVIDVVVTGTDYCIRIYNVSSETYKDLATAAIKESSSGVCDANPPSSAAIAGAPAEAGTTLSWTQHTSIGSRSWNTAVSSSDGSKLVVIAGNNIYVSQDGGDSWTQTPSPDGNFYPRTVVSSANGSMVYMAGSYYSGGRAYSSTDYGVTLTLAGLSVPVVTPYDALVSSSDGMNLAYVSAYDMEGLFSGRLLTSTNAGANWTNRTSATGTNQNWRGIDSSSDGSNLVATDSANIMTSTDYGASWTNRNFTHAGTWGKVASSSDGTKLAVTTVNGSSGVIYTSADSGVTWTERTSAGARNWGPIAMSADGTRVVAGEAGAGGSLYGSTNSGATWTQLTGAGTGTWRTIDISSDGSKIIAASGTYVYTGDYE